MVFVYRENGRFHGDTSKVPRSTIDMPGILENTVKILVCHLSTLVGPIV
jgi:hypothetical protein